MAGEASKNEEPIPYAMSDNDVDKVRARLANLDSKQLSEICDGYVRYIKNIIVTGKKMLDPVEDEDDLVEVERLYRIIALLPNDELFIRSKDKIWSARKQILDKNMDWFISRDYTALIKKDQKQVMIETLLRIFRTKYHSLSDEEKEFYWNKIFGILNLVAKYKKLTGEP